MLCKGRAAFTGDLPGPVPARRAGLGFRRANTERHRSRPDRAGPRSERRSIFAFPCGGDVPREIPLL